MITIAGWIGHALLYPAFTVYLWAVTPGARAFEVYLASMIERLEELREAELDTLEHARV